MLSRFDSYGRGGEDGFLELCLADFLGRQVLSFLITANSKVRWRRFVMGRGSATLSRVLMDNKLQRNKWTERDLLKAAQFFFCGRAHGFQSARVAEAWEAAQFTIGLNKHNCMHLQGMHGGCAASLCAALLLAGCFLGHHRHRITG